MTRSSRRPCVRVGSLREMKSLVEEAPEASGERCRISIEKITPKLVDGDGHDQAGRLALLAGNRARQDYGGESCPDGECEHTLNSLK